MAGKHRTKKSNLFSGTRKSKVAVAGNGQKPEHGSVPLWVGYIIAPMMQVLFTAVLMLIGERLPIVKFPIFFVLPTMMVAYYFGFGPALLSFILGGLLLDYNVIQPIHAFWPISNSPQGWATLLAYLAGAFTVGSATLLMRQGRMRIEGLLDDAESELDVRRRMEAQLREQTEILEEQARLLDFAHVLVRDRDDRIVVWNSGLETLYGYSREEALGRVSHELLHTVFPQSEEVVAEALATTGHWQGEIAHRTRDSRKVIVASHQVLHRDSFGEPLAVLEVNNDITELKKAEEALNKAHQELQNSSEELMAMNEELMTSNEQLNREVLERKRAEAALNKTHNELQDSSEELMATNEELSASNDELQCEIRERKRVEDALQQATSYLENLLGYANAPIIVWDPTFKITRFNHAFEQLTGYTADDIIGRELSMLFPDESCEDSLSKIEQTLRGEQWESVEIPIRRQDGEVRIVLWNSANVHDSSGLTIVATIAQGQDITRRVLAEEELGHARTRAEQNSAELKSFIGSMADGIALLDANAKIVFMNDAGREMLGLPQGDVSINWIDDYKACTFDGDVIPIEERPSYKALHGETVKEIRCKLTGPDEKETMLSFSASAVHDTEGRVIGATTVFREISEQVELERLREEIFRREHHIADTLQRAIIPPVLDMVLPGYDIAVRYQPALKEAEIGGDFYDVFDLGDGKFGILIGDVVGKGLQAAMRVAAARYSIRSYAFLDPSPAFVLTRANSTLSKGNADSGNMLTAVLAIVDVNNSVLTYASGGHVPPIIRRKDGQIEEFASTGCPLGILGDIVYDEVTLNLRSGDTILMVTDGITEARPHSTLFFGSHGLKRYLSKQPRESVDEIAAGLLAAAIEHAGGSLQDDAAIVVFEANYE